MSVIENAQTHTLPPRSPFSPDEPGSPGLPGIPSKPFSPFGPIDPKLIENYFNSFKVLNSSNFVVE